MAGNSLAYPRQDPTGRIYAGKGIDPNGNGTPGAPPVRPTGPAAPPAPAPAAPPAPAPAGYTAQSGAGKPGWKDASGQWMQDNIPIAGGVLNDLWGGGTSIPDPNTTVEGQNLAAQRGNLQTFGGAADYAQQHLGNDVNLSPAQQQQAQTYYSQQAHGDQASQMTIAQMQAAQMQGAQLDTAQANQARAAQQQLAGSLQQTASGQGPSVAQELLRQNTATNINQQNSAAMSMHGAARLAAMRNAQQAGAVTQQTAASQAAGLRAQEIATAQGNLGNVLGMQRGQDVTTAQQNAQLAQQTGMTNAQLAQQGALANAGFLQGGEQYNAGNRQAMTTLGMQQEQQNNQFNASQSTQNNQFNAGQGNDLSRFNAGLGLSQAQLNTQRQQAVTNAMMGSAQGQTGISSELYQGSAAYQQAKAQSSKDLASTSAQALASGSWFSGGGGAAAGGASSMGGGAASSGAISNAEPILAA